MVSLRSDDACIAILGERASGGAVTDVDRSPITGVDDARAIDRGEIGLAIPLSA